MTDTDSESDDPTAVETDATVVVIVAADPDGVIGVDGEMPWHYPEDLAHFERTTTGNPVILGRRTYDSITAQIGGPLPDRTNVVLSRSDPDVPESVRVVSSPAAALRAADAAPSADGRIFVAGGATVYRQLLPAADRLLRTEIHDCYEGDTHFEWEPDRWRETGREPYEGFDVVTYVRR